MSDLPPRAGESDVSNLVDVGEGRPRPAWRVEQNRDWGWCVRNGVFTKSGITGKSEEGYVAYRLKDKTTAELIAAAPARAQRLAEVETLVARALSFIACGYVLRGECGRCETCDFKDDLRAALVRAAVLGNDPTGIEPVASVDDWGDGATDIGFEPVLGNDGEPG